MSPSANGCKSEKIKYSSLNAKYISEQSLVQLTSFSREGFRLGASSSGPFRAFTAKIKT
jgi:hypothetical protein